MIAEKSGRLWVATDGQLFSFDPAQAAATRRAFLERYCEQDVLVCASHFPSPSFGRVVREGNGFWFEYLKA